MWLWGWGSCVKSMWGWGWRILWRLFFWQWQWQCRGWETWGMSWELIPRIRCKLSVQVSFQVSLYIEWCFHFAKFPLYFPLPILHNYDYFWNNFVLRSENNHIMVGVAVLAMPVSPHYQIHQFFQKILLHFSVLFVCSDCVIYLLFDFCWILYDSWKYFSISIPLFL